MIPVGCPVFFSAAGQRVRWSENRKEADACSMHLQFFLYEDQRSVMFDVAGQQQVCVRSAKTASSSCGSDSLEPSSLLCMERRWLARLKQHASVGSINGSKKVSYSMRHGELVNRVPAEEKCTSLQLKTVLGCPCKYFLVLGSFVVPFVLPLTRKGRKSDYGYNNMRSVCFVFFGIIGFLSQRRLFILFSFEKMSWIGVVPTSCACPQSSVFARWILAVRGAPPQERTEKAGWFSLWWGALVSVWFWLFGRKIRARRWVRGQRPPPPPPPPQLRRQSTSGCGENLLASGEEKVTVVLYMWCLPCRSYVDSACSLLGLFYAYVWFGMSLSKIQSTRVLVDRCMAPPWLWPLSLSSSRTAWRMRERQRERERERERAVIRKSRLGLEGSVHNKKEFFLQTERENEIFKQDVCVHACRTRRGT